MAETTQLASTTTTSSAATSSTDTPLSNGMMEREVFASDMSAGTGASNSTATTQSNKTVLIAIGALVAIAVLGVVVYLLFRKPSKPPVVATPVPIQKTTACPVAPPCPEVPECPKAPSCPVCPKNYLNPHLVAYFEGPGLSGLGVVVGAGNWNVEHIRGWLGNRTIRSMYVPAGKRAMIYSAAGFTGSHQDIVTRGNQRTARVSLKPGERYINDLASEVGFLPASFRNY